MSASGSIVPLPGTVPAAAVRSYVFEIVPSTPLPTLDLSVSFRTRFLGPTASRWWLAFVRRTHRLQAFSYNMCVALTPGILLLPPTLGTWLAVFKTVLCVPPLLSMGLSLRLDLLLLLMRTYDFWFFSVLNWLACLALVAYVRDARALMMLLMGIGYEMSIVVDANMSLMRLFIVPAVLGIWFNLMVLLLVEMNLVNSSHNEQLPLATHDIELRDVITNGMSTLAVLLLRNAYRRFRAFQLADGDRSIVCCISYRCTVRFQPITDASQASVKPVRRRSSRFSLGIFAPSEASVAVPTAAEGPRVQMFHVPINETFDGRRVLSGTQDPEALWSTAQRVALIVLGLTSATLSLFAYWVAMINDSDEPAWLFIATVVGSGLFCGSFWMVSQPQLLRRLCVSFDFVFVSLQITVTFCAVCDMFWWDYRSFVVLAAWLWIHWVLTLDAVLPLTRRRMGFQRRFALPFIVAFAGAQMLFAGKCIFASSWKPQNRVVYAHEILGRHVEIRVAPFVFTRTILLIFWSLRVTWRVYIKREDELIMIKGVVAYEPVAPARRRLTVEVASPSTYQTDRNPIDKS
ncbi:hypothetical protein ATCC90586_005841 [Pythium insidiosum]|nr:hypothetical protein ATCC90586_005841 [Pythium insidiosum]